MYRKSTTSSRHNGPREIVPRSGVTTGIAKPPSRLNTGGVIDIGGSQLPHILRGMLENNLIQPDSTGKRLLSSPLLSDDIGLKLWSKLTYLPNYYQTTDEIELLQQNGQEIASHVAPGSTIFDLGAGYVVAR